jgi:ABC-type glycerol-3-phosphate transport system substrate-binding protein
MRIRSARFFLFLVQLAAVGVLASALTASAATTVRWLTLSDGAWPDSVKKVIAAFEAENPDIKVELDTYPFRQLFETIEVRMGSGPGCGQEVDQGSRREDRNLGL